ncbi:hypothetical protein LJB92_03915, partial [Bacteroidales bacterium OttesenSCG-928-M06]|nr:hypothetical protein [Bacteroidales bacterium OttesenSCG-928-M06]
MYDTVNFRLTVADVKDVDFLQETPCYLDGVAFHDYNSEQVITGSLNGLKVSANKYQVKVKDGSLCKWYLGDNFQTLGRGDVQRAIEKLSDTLHLPMSKAIITRLDVAQNFITKHPSMVYFNHLGVLKYATRLQEPNGLYYCRQAERLCFYDKNKEQKAKSEPIPELYRGRNVLRYEQRYTQRLASRFNVPAVTGALLYDEAFYIGVLDRWRDTYKEISKINDITLNFQAMTSKQQLYKMGVLSMVERVGGEVEMIAQINEAQKRGDLTAKQAFDLRQAVKEACKAGDGLTVPNEAIAELDKKIMEAVR